MVSNVLPSGPLLLFIVFGAWGRRILPSALLIIGIVDVVSSVVEEGLVSANGWSTMPNLGTKAEYVMRYKISLEIARDAVTRRSGRAV